jgi:hypothetical protein
MPLVVVVQEKDISFKVITLIQRQVLNSHADNNYQR